MRFESVALEEGDRSSFVREEARLGGEGEDTTSFGDWKLGETGETIGPNHGTIPIVGSDDFSYTRT